MKLIRLPLLSDFLHAAYDQVVPRQQASRDSDLRKMGVLAKKHILAAVDLQIVIDMSVLFVKLLESRKRLTDEFPSSLLYRMATNTCLNRLRNGKRKPETAGDELLLSIATADEVEPSIEARSVLDRLFGNEPSTHTIAVLHYIDGKTLEETAREVEMSVSGVRKRLRKLRETLTGLEPE